MKKNLLIVSLLAVALAGCSPDPVPQPQYQAPAVQPVPQTVVQNPVVQPAQVVAAPAPAPVIINQAPANNDGSALTGALIGGAVGYMAGSASNNSSYDRGYDRRYSDSRYDNRRPVVVNKTVVVKQYNAPKNVTVVKQAPRQSYAPTPSPSRMSLSKSSSSSRSSFGGFSRRK